MIIVSETPLRISLFVMNNYIIMLSIALIWLFYLLWITTVVTFKLNWLLPQYDDHHRPIERYDLNITRKDRTIRKSYIQHRSYRWSLTEWWCAFFSCSHRKNAFIFLSNFLCEAQASLDYSKIRRYEGNNDEEDDEWNVWRAVEWLAHQWIL